MSDHPLKDFYSKIYATYDRVNRIFTFGQDVAWRRKAAGICLEAQPDSFLDVCTGTGDFVLELARQAEGQSRNMRLEGYDFSPEMLAVAREKKEKQLPERDINFMEGEVGSMPYGDGSFEAMGITFGIRNLVYQNSMAERHLDEMKRVLKAGGRLVILESSRPGNPIWRLFNNIYLQFILPYLGALFSGNLKAYRYLATSSKNYYSPEEMASLLEKAGFECELISKLFLGSVMLVVVRKPK